MRDPLVARYPVDETTYDLLLVLSSKLEAMHVYERFGNEDRHRELARELMEDDARHASQLLDALRDRLVADAPHASDGSEERESPFGMGALG